MLNKFLYLLLISNSAVAFESVVHCTSIGKNKAQITSLMIQGAGTFFDVAGAPDGVAVTAEARTIQIQKLKIQNEKFIGFAQGSAKGPYYELKSTTKNPLIKEIFISAIASGSRSTLTDAKGNEFPLKCK